VWAVCLLSSVLIIVAWAPSLAWSGSDSSKHLPRFEQDVQPLFVAHCARCHGSQRHEGSLNLTSREGVFRGSDSGPIVTPGNPGESLLFSVLQEGRMPPDKKSPLSASEVETVRRWIQAGAPTAAAARTGAARDALLTENDILPSLLQHCTVCHGARKKEGGLDLRSRAAMLKGGKSGPALLPGHPEASLLTQKIERGQMPPWSQTFKVSVKPMTAGELGRLKQWIAGGAPETPLDPDLAAGIPDRAVTDADRKFWSFQPPRRVAVPKSSVPGARNPIDLFIGEKLRAKGLHLSPEADRLVLLRRATLDLTGLLPEPSEIQAFLADRAPNAYERLIDRLLASPAYGERWARYWLDAAGYADSDGHFADSVRPYAYRYRDYVIRSFNADKPYDRFLLEQIAGDELADYEHAPVITPELMDNLVATGFLRMAPDGTNPPELNYVPERVDVIADEMEIFGSAVMGLTIKCARCHDHKYDPIPQRDYYRLVADFKGAFDEYDWLKPYYRNLPNVTPDERQKPYAYNRPFREKVDALKQALSQKAEARRKKRREAELAKLPPDVRRDVRQMLATPPKRRSPRQKRLAQKYEQELRFDDTRLKQCDAEFNKASQETAAKIGVLGEKMLPSAEIVALWDRGEPSPTFVYSKGDYQKPGRVVGPGIPSVLTDGRTPFVVHPPWKGAKKTGRRLALARWLTRSDHPLTARVMVNRIWEHHFGRGLVETLDNFGHTGARPTHPDLLDWLAREFVARGWSVKAMQRLLMTSAVYRQSSARRPAQEAGDPDNRLLGRMPLKRMEAEAVYDSLLEVAGRLDRRCFDVPDPVDVRSDGLVTPVATPRGYRRSIYVLHRRKEIPTLLENFDFPNMTPNCIERTTSTVATQALTLMNGGQGYELAQAFARRAKRAAGSDSSRQIDWIWLAAFSRPATPGEKSLCRESLAHMTRVWAGQNRSDRGESPSGRALATFCHTILNSAGFLTVD
jgi:cytochrome c553